MGTADVENVFLQEAEPRVRQVPRCAMAGESFSLISTANHKATETQTF